MPSLGPLEILVVLLVAVLVFPPQKLPEIARQVGRAMSQLRRFQGNLTAELDRAMTESDPPTLPPKPAPEASPANDDELSTEPRSEPSDT